MSQGKLGKWLNDNIIMLVGIPLIIGVHYGWLKLQEMPHLRDQTEKKDLPIIAALKKYKEIGLEKYNSITSNSTSSEPQEK